ncbi:MAG: PASTA domain-containing protein [Bacteroidia bacterium]|nr:PASTA domain-containing protein [Bacteroidia bacterium]
MKVPSLIKVLTINIFLAVLLILILAIVTLFALNKYTHHGEALSVPDFTGLTFDEVKQLCIDKKLKYQVIDSVYSTEFSRGTVVDQSPETNFKVKENRTIFLTINAVYPEHVKMPNVVGVSLRQATALLETFGLKTGKLIYKPDWATNNVLKQLYKGKQIKEGILIEKWSVIDLVVGKQSYEKGIVPSVTSLSFTEAEKRITECGFNIGITEYDESIKTPTDSMKAIVWKQSPVHHEKISVSLGSAIDLWLSLEIDKESVVDSVMNNSD